MSFKLRNTLILLAQVLIICSISIYFIVFLYPKRIDAQKSELQELNEFIKQIPEREEYLKNMLSVIEEKKQQVASLDKVVESDITFGDALSYIDRIQSFLGLLKFSLNSLKEVQAEGYGYRIFSIEGEGTFQSVFSMIWALERGPKIFIIDDLMLHGFESVQRKKHQQLVTITFNLEIRALYADIPDFPFNKKTLVDVKVPKVRNIFYPMIASAILPNTRGLLDVERAKLQAILQDKAIVSDHEGKLYVLNEGDEVYLGYLTKINQNHNWLEFTLNKGGIVERFILKLSFNSDVKLENE